MVMDDRFEAVIERLRRVETLLRQTRRPSLLAQLETMIRSAEHEVAGAIVSDDPRVAQASVLWASGFGTGSYFDFESYLASIPEIPKDLLELSDPRFPLLVLVDPRPRLKKMLSVARIPCEMNTEKFRVHMKDWKRCQWNGPFWMRCNNGRSMHRDHEVLRTFHDKLAAEESALSLEEGVALCMQYPEVTDRFSLIFPSTLATESRTDVAYIGSDRCVAATWEGACSNMGFPTRFR